MMRLVLVFIVSVLIAGSSGQFPGMDFMQTIYNNIGRMSSQFQHMNRDIFARAQAGRRFGPGATRFRTADGGTGFVYNSPDGSGSSYTFSSGGPSHGFVYSFGPNGEFRRQW